MMLESTSAFGDGTVSCPNAERSHMTVAEMREKRKELGYSIPQMSSYTGIPCGTLVKIFCGETLNPRRATLNAIEQVLSADPKVYCGKARQYETRRGSALQNLEAMGYVPDMSSASCEDGNQRLLKEPKAVYHTTADSHDENHTIEEYHRLPEGTRVELIDGKYFTLESPVYRHQQILQNAFLSLSLQFQKEGGACKVCISPLDVHLKEHAEDTVVQPDLFILCDDTKIHADGFVWGPPDFILEVLSPGTRKKDLNYKCWKYFDAGVREFWAIDPDMALLIKYTLEDDYLPHMMPLDHTEPLWIYGGKVQLDLKAL